MVELGSRPALGIQPVEHGPAGPPAATAPRAHTTLLPGGTPRWGPTWPRLWTSLRGQQKDEVCSAHGPGRERGFGDGIGALVRREILLGHHVPAHHIAHVPCCVVAERGAQ